MPNKKANAERSVQDAALCKGKHMQKISRMLCPFAGLSVLGIDTIVLFYFTLLQPILAGYLLTTMPHLPPGSPVCHTAGPSLKAHSYWLDPPEIDIPIGSCVSSIPSF